jgi:cyanophycin synthetase
MPCLEMRVADVRLLAGSAAGLSERTALALVEYITDGPLDSAAQERLRAGVTALVPDDPLYGVRAADWPEAFLADAGDPAGLDGHRLGEWVAALTVAVQRWARDPVFGAQVVDAGAGSLRIALPWRREALLRDALDLALRLITQWARAEQDAAALEQLHTYLRDGLSSARGDGLPPNTLRFVQSAVARGIPFDILPSCVQLGWGAAAERMDSSFTGRTGVIASSMARNKFKSSRTLADAGIPTPTGQVVADAERAEQVAQRLGWPVVVKPLNHDQGVGVVPGIRDVAALRRAVAAADKLSPGQVIVETHVSGADHRLLVVAGRMLAAGRLIPAGVTGDGVHTVQQLVDNVNADPLRGTNPRSILKKLVLDATAKKCLAEQSLNNEAVPAAGRRVYLRHTANISTGGTAVDVTGVVHRDNAELAVRAARMVGLDIAGIDFLCPDISRSWREVGGALCEINAQPGFRPHWIADPDRDINGEVVDILFERNTGRIPVVAFVGDQTAAAAADLLHAIWTDAGVLTGVCSTGGVRIGAGTVSLEDRAGFTGGRILLTDPGVEAAVIQLTPQRLGETGHPCDRYDVLVVIDGDEIARADAGLAHRARTALVLNADDPAALALATVGGPARVVLVSRDPHSAAVSEHRDRGGDAVLVDDSGWVLAASGEVRRRLIRWTGRPAALFAAAAAWAQGLAESPVQ